MERHLLIVSRTAGSGGRALRRRPSDEDALVGMRRRRRAARQRCVRTGITGEKVLERSVLLNDDNDVREVLAGGAAVLCRRKRLLRPEGRRRATRRASYR